MDDRRLVPTVAVGPPFSGVKGSSFKSCRHVPGRLLRLLPAGRAQLPQGDFRDWVAIDDLGLR